MLLAALALLPLAGLVFYNAEMQRREAAAEAENVALRLARMCANNEERMVESADQLLALMAEMPGVRKLDAQACGPLFARELGHATGYANLGLLDAEGKVVASAKPVAMRTPAARQTFFKQALDSGTFAVSEFELEPDGEQAEMMCGAQVRSDDGRVAGVIFAELDLACMTDLVSRLGLPPGVTISVLNLDGMIMMRFPEPEKWVGKSAVEGALGRAILQRSGSGTAEGEGLDHVRRLFAFTPLDPRHGLGAFLSAGIPEEIAFRPARRSEHRQLAMLAVFALAAFAAAWFAAEILVLRQVRRLLRATQEVAAGDLRTRAGPAHGGGEFRELAQAFDTMASSLEKQSRERDEAEKELERRVEERTAALRESESKLRAFITSVPAILFSIDRSGVITMAEGQGMEVLNFIKGGVVGHSVESYAGMPGLAESVKRALAGESFSTTMQLQQFFFEVSYSPIHAEDGTVTGVTGVAHDITERVRAKEELERTAEELRRSNAELEQFAYIASHDLQEPLRMVASYTQLLERRYADRLDDAAREFIGYAVDGAKRMQQFIAGLLDLSRMGREPWALEEVNLQEVFGNAVANLRIAIEESGARVESGPLPVVRGDARQLTQLFQNLIGNALKFREPGEAPRVDVRADRDGDCWRISVRDNGIGLDPRFSERVFTIFQRLHTRDEYEGTGLGLAICKKIVDRHGGRIWVESREGEGATFFFTLPAADKTSP